tara:strand:- start:2406 stop:2726 length:321 start_codon:yes stop_codon:yes gene_type:complete
MINIYDFMDELYYLLDSNNISLEENDERDRAIRILLQTKKRMATKEVVDKEIINVYRKKGMEGIKKYFDRKVCYLYHTNFIYNVLFYHYKAEWKKLENIIKDKIDE